jgi:hypothetical protein
VAWPVADSGAKEIRDFCIFSTDSVICDPPSSRLDLISCRNLLIYLGSDFQARVIPAFHFALRPGGFLFLGSSENVGQYNEPFQRVDRKHRLFRRRDHVVSSLQFPMFAPVRKSGGEIQPGQRDLIPTAANLRKIADARVLDQLHRPMWSSTAKARSSIIQGGRENTSKPRLDCRADSLSLRHGAACAWTCATHCRKRWKAGPW